jgi:hypothetical protein
MRTSEDPHGDAAPYALGVLDAADAYRFEDHLMECPRCSLQVTGFGPVRAQLDAYVRCTPPGVPLFAQYSGPPPGMLPAMLRGAEAVGRRSRRRRLALLAAAAVLVAGGPLGVLTASAPGAARGSLHWGGRDGATGTTAVATVAARAWGSAVSFELSGVEAASGTCALVAIGRDGTRETVTTWQNPAYGGRPLVTAGDAALAPGEIDHFEVLTETGRRLVVLSE